MNRFAHQDLRHLVRFPKIPKTFDIIYFELPPKVLMHILVFRYKAHVVIYWISRKVFEDKWPKPPLNLYSLL